MEPVTKGGERQLIALLLEALPLGALLIDGEGKIAAANRQAELFLGWASTALRGQSAHALLQCHMEELGPAPENCPVGRALAGERVEADARMWVRCRGEVSKPVEFRCVPFPMGRAAGALLVFRDLSRQLEMENDLNSLASIAAASPVAIVELNEDANIIRANPAMMSLIDRFGFNDDVRPIVLPADIVEITNHCLLRQAEIDGIEITAQGHFFEWKFVPVPRVRTVRGYGTDMTARRQAELALRQAQAEAAKAVSGDAKAFNPSPET